MDEPKTRKKKGDKKHRNFSYRGAYSPQHIRKQEELQKKKLEVDKKTPSKKKKSTSKC